MLLRPPHHLLHRAVTASRRNAIAWIALFLALGAGGSYALAASASNGTVVVCADKSSGIMHLAKHKRCGRHQTRVGLSSALDRPTVSAWAAANVNGGIESGVGRFDNARGCRDVQGSGHRRGLPACVQQRAGGEHQRQRAAV